MREPPPLQHGEQRMRTLMFGVTGAAIRLRIDLHHAAMNGFGIEHLGGDIHMTG